MKRWKRGEEVKMIEWKREWNATHPMMMMSYDAQVKRRLFNLYKGGKSFAQLSLMLQNRISASGIRSMLIKEGWYTPKVRRR